LAVGEVDVEGRRGGQTSAFDVERRVRRSPIKTKRDETEERRAAEKEKERRPKTPRSIAQFRH
jgi:hypothetical protein